MDIVTAVGDRGHPGNGRPGSDLPGNGARRHAQADAGPGERHAIDAVDDVALVMGMPGGSIPPQLQARITALMDEVERLRGELAQLRRHEDLLRGQADRHPLLPALNRRAFLRELTRLMAQAERSGLPGTLLLVHLSGIDALREAQGIEAGEAALAHAVEIIRAECDQLDLLGYLDGGDIALALAMVGEDEAASRERRIAERLASTPFLWNGTRPLLAVASGRAAFAADTAAEALLRAADAARRLRA